jgi:hypothetical protein
VRDGWIEGGRACTGQKGPSIGSWDATRSGDPPATRRNVASLLGCVWLQRAERASQNDLYGDVERWPAGPPAAAGGGRLGVVSRGPMCNNATRVEHISGC